MKVGKPIDEGNSNDQYWRMIEDLQCQHEELYTEQKKIMGAFGLADITLPNGKVIKLADDIDPEYSEMDIKTFQYQARQTHFNQQVYKSDWDIYDQIEKALPNLREHVKKMNNGKRKEITRPKPDWGYEREDVSILLGALERKKGRIDRRIDTIYEIMKENAQGRKHQEGTDDGDVDGK
jgi:hypothetical protein